MDSRPEQLKDDVDRVPAWWFVTQGLWIALRLIAGFYLGQAGEKFFYQGF
jgi:hypothetical protein